MAEVVKCLLCNMYVAACESTMSFRRIGGGRIERFEPPVGRETMAGVFWVCAPCRSIVHHEEELELEIAKKQFKADAMKQLEPRARYFGPEDQTHVLDTGVG